MDWRIPLGVAAALFGSFVLFRLRPVLGSERNEEAKRTLGEARAQLRKATTEVERAEALAAAGDACARTRTLRRLAPSYYGRALKLRPSDPALLRRAAAGLARRPFALETLLVRRLGATPWSDKEAVVAALEELLKLYRGRLRSVARAQMIERALESVSGSLPSEET